jgi:hypothetical protein
LKNQARFYFARFFLIFIQSIFAQNSIDNFLKPSDSLNKVRLKTLIVSESILLSGTIVGLNQLWYANYPRSNFHFINDNKEWLQMDKAGHLFSTYHIGRFGSEMMQWSGTTKQHQLIYGAGLGFAFLTAVEVLDGFSSQWGASPGDVIANASGTALYVSQELIWKEQRVTPKFSFHKTRFASLRPAVLGHSLNEQILKDYNGQTYWLSTNLYSFSKGSKMPKWLNIAIGYGADGMISGNSNKNSLILAPKPEIFRQFYLSFDADLTKINTKSHFLKTFFSVFNTLKIPAPTIEYGSHGRFKFHAIYF